MFIRLDSRYTDPRVFVDRTDEVEVWSASSTVI